MVSKFKIVRRLLTTLLLTLSVLTSQKALASHYAAVDLHVDYIGTGPGNYVYRVFLEVYKACEAGSIDLNTQERVYWRSVAAGYSDNRLFSDPDHTGVEGDTVDQLCPGLPADNSCRNSTSIFPGFVRKMYVDTVTLPSAQADWQFSWSGSARNSGIVNLATLGNIFVECGLNNQLKYNNSSPRFTVPPFPYICVNQPNIFLNSPVDPDGDSLFTYTHFPKDNNGATPGTTFGVGPWSDVQFLCPPPPAICYSLANPVNTIAANPFAVDPVSGAASFTPQTTGKFVMAFRCDEYDKNTGIRTGYTFRDVQVSVLACNSAPPIFPPVVSTNVVEGVIAKDSTDKLTVYTCPGNNLSIDISAETQISANILTMESNSDIIIPGSTFTVTGSGSNNPIAKFQWSPTLADVGEHTFVITAKDSTCIAAQPIILKSFKVVTIRVFFGVSAGPDLLLCPGTSRQIMASAPVGIKYEWSPTTGLSDPSILTPTAGPATTTQYVLTAPELTGFCKSKDTVDVVINLSNSLDAQPDNPAILCHPGYLQLDAGARGPGPKTNIPCGTINPINCITPAEITVLGPTLTGGFPAVEGPQDTIHLNPDVYRTFATDVRTSKQQFLINRHRMMDWGINSGTLKSLAFSVVSTPSNTYQYNNFRISLKCTDSASLGTNFETGMIPVYTATAPVTLPPGWNEFTFQTPYNWDTTKNLVIEICYSNNATALAAGNNPTINYVRRADPADANGNPVFLRLANIPGTASTATDTCDATTGLYRDQLRPVFRFDYCETPPSPFVYTWSPGTFLSDSTIQSPLAYVPKSIKYNVETKGRSGCLLQDSVDIFVPNQHYRVSPSDTSICYGEGTPINIYTNGEIKQPEDGGMKYYQWLTSWYKLVDDGSLSNVTRPGVIASPKANALYYILVVDSVGCRDTLQAYVEVRPLPKVDILGNDTLVKFGTSLQLLANGARLYSWDPVSSLNNPNISHPIATPLEPTMYTVTGIGANGCRASDTLKVDLDMRDKLFIPTAFSPNGDGKNDVFRVANLTFQKLVEFRVYNRWGQEVYSTTDNKKGWDGTWKGSEQEIGVYQYLIRVAYPDGYLDTYKGDVTLVR